MINTSLGEYPGVIMTIVLRRKINYHLLQVITMLLLAIFILLISIFRPLSLFVLLIFPFWIQLREVHFISSFPQKSGIFNRCLSNSCQNHDASPSLRIQLGKTNNPWNSQNWSQHNFFFFSSHSLCIYGPLCIPFKACLFSSSHPSIIMLRFASCILTSIICIKFERLWKGETQWNLSQFFTCAQIKRALIFYCQLEFNHMITSLF